MSNKDGRKTLEQPIDIKVQGNIKHKKTYSKPKLVLLGDIYSFTKGGNVVGMNDMGGPSSGKT